MPLQNLTHQVTNGAEAVPGTRLEARSSYQRACFNPRTYCPYHIHTRLWVRALAVPSFT